MKSKFTRIKTGAKAVSARSVALMLCFVMLVTAICAGSVMSAFAVKSGYATVEQDDAAADSAAADKAVEDTAAPDAAQADAPDVALTADENSDDEEPILSAKGDSDLADTGADADLAQTGDRLWDTMEGKNPKVYGTFYPDGSYKDTWSDVSLYVSSWNEASVTFLCPANYTYRFRVKHNGTSYQPKSNQTIYNTNTTYTYDTGFTVGSTNYFTLNTKNSSTGFVKVIIHMQQAGSGSNYWDRLYVEQADSAVPNAFGQPNGQSSWNASNTQNLSYDSTSKCYYYDVQNAGTVIFRFWLVANNHYSPQNDSTNQSLSSSSSSPSSTWRKGTNTEGAAFTVNTTGKNVRIWINAKNVDASWNGVTAWYESSDMSYSLWGGQKKELNSTVHLTNLTKNATTGLYDGTITLSSTDWYSLKPSASQSTTTFSQVWDSYSEVAWAVNTYNSNTVYQNYSSWHREPSTGSMSSGILNFVEITDYSGGAWGLKLQAKTAGTVVNVSFDATNKIIYLYGSSSTVTKVDVYAKDGAAPINWDDKESGGATNTSGITKDGSQVYYYNYAIIADTTVTSSDTSASFSDGDCTISGASSSGSTYRYGQVEGGKTITVTTTISGTYSSRYYVAGWSVNGVTYKNGTDTVGVNPSSATSYSFTYTIPADTDSLLKDKANNPVIEITPIYYLKSPGTSVTFYLEGYSDVQSKWGNTPYVYPFYGNLSGYQNTFGVYPGQPMVNVNGQYSTEIPINTTTIDTSKQPSTTKVKGITISNGYADHVHRNLIYDWSTGSDVNDDKDHMQTYDYDDFDKIYEERLVNGEHPNAIFFRIKEETTKYNRSSYGGGSTGGQLQSGTSTINISTIASSGNGWELMKDRHDRNVNIFGDYSAVSSLTPSSATADTSQAIYVVSTGYNANIAGDYGTMWKIYNGSGTLITTDSTNSRYGIPPSLLNISGSTSGWNPVGTYSSASHSVDGVGSYTDSNDKYLGVYKLLQAANVKNKLVYITYEKDTQDTRKVSTGTGAYRLDGKWFYTHATDNVQSKISVEYYDRTTGTWVADTKQTASTGLFTTTQAKAVFSSGSYASASDKTVSTNPLISAGSTWSFTADENGTGYAFSGWYYKYEDTYEPLTSSTSGSIKATANYTLVARYVPTTTGTLVITHQIDPESTGAGDATMTVTYNNSSQTVNYVNGVARANVSVTYTSTARNIVVALTATPRDDGTVTAFNLDNQVDPTATGGSVPGAENTALTKTLTFTNKDLYNSDGSIQRVSQLDYTSTITATPHYYEFTYSFTDRDGANKSYKTRGEITQEHYNEYVDSSHNVSDAFVKSRAPFESNFFKTLKLDQAITKGYTSDTHTLTASTSYSATDWTPDYTVKIKLPYTYRTASSGTSYKKYNATSPTANSSYNTSTAAFYLMAKYDGFVTIDATDSAPGTSTKTTKVTDGSDPNHTGNDFITAPDTLKNGTSTTMYFKYWEIKRLADTDEEQSEAPAITRVYFPDLNYRFYADSYVEAVYSSTAADLWSTVKAGNTYSDISCSVLYLESSRNQWNMNGNSSTSTSETVAADKIYNDFVFNYNYKGKENISSSDAEIGMVLERVYYTESGSNKWATGSTSVSDMDSYRDSYSDTEEARSSSITSWLQGGSAVGGCVKVTWDNSELNNKNFTEQPYSVYSQYGQTVDTHSITFKTDNPIDNYVYRAWAYIKDKSTGTVTLSSPAYFSMRFVADLNYSE